MLEETAHPREALALYRTAGQAQGMFFYREDCRKKQLQLETEGWDKPSATDAAAKQPISP